MHAGNLPGYPASVGCVRLPVDFAAKLYTVTSMGSTVIIADNNSAPSTTTSSGLLFSAQGSANGGAVWTPEKAPKGPVSTIVSAPDSAAYVYRNGIEIGRSPVGGIGRLSGSHVYSALSSVDVSGRRDWISTASVGGRAPSIRELAKRAAIPPDFLAKVRALITLGTTLVLTAAPVNPQTHSGRGFNILSDRLIGKTRRIRGMGLRSNGQEPPESAFSRIVPRNGCMRHEITGGCYVYRRCQPFCLAAARCSG